MPIANTFQSLQPNTKETYSGSKKKKDRFKRLKSLIESKRKATAELEASRDPQKFMEKMKEPSIRGLKGIAF